MKLNPIFERGTRTDGSTFFYPAGSGDRSSWIDGWCEIALGVTVYNDCIYTMLNRVADWFIEANDQESTWLKDDDRETIDAFREYARAELASMFISHHEMREWFFRAWGDYWIDEMRDEFGDGCLILGEDHSMVRLIDRAMRYHYEIMIRSFPIEKLLYIDNPTA